MKMDSVGPFLDEEWESLNKMFSTEDSNYFLHHFDAFSNDQNVPRVDGNLFSPSSTLLDTSFYNMISLESSESCETNTALFTNQRIDINVPRDVISHDAFESMSCHQMNCSSSNGSSTVPFFTDEVMEELLLLKAQLSTDQLSNPQVHQTETNDDSCKKRRYKRKYKAPDKSEDKSSSERPKKKSGAQRNEQMNKRNVQSRKKKAVEVGNNEEESISSADDSNASQEPIDGSNSDCPNTNGKTRVSRGSASDPQSIYAKKRRARINERLKTLQNLVPNGTKVDISTMLEEAVHYVKFLQLQIKLLSSDDMWMYSPIAYNGMDMGLYQKMILPNLWLQN